MNKFGLFNWAGAIGFARNTYYAGRDAIFGDQTLSELGKKAQLARLVQKLAADVWENDIYADYVMQKNAVTKLLEMHMAKKPKQQTPTAEQVMLEGRAYKQLLTKLAMADDPVAVLKGVAGSDDIITKNAMLVNFSEIMDKVLSKVAGKPGGEDAVANLWGGTKKLGNQQPSSKATIKAQEVQLNDILKGIYNTVANSLKTEKEIKWETGLAEIMDADAEINANYNMAERVFSKMWAEEFGTSLSTNTERITLDPWAIEQQAKQQEDEFIAAAKRAGNVSGIGKYPGYR